MLLVFDFLSFSTSMYLLFILNSFTNQIGEVFVMASMDEANEMLEETKETLETEIKNLDSKCEDHKKVLSNLKVKLHAKFGNNINLEAEDEG